MFRTTNVRSNNCCATRGEIRENDVVVSCIKCIAGTADIPGLATIILGKSIQSGSLRFLPPPLPPPKKRKNTHTGKVIGDPFCCSCKNSQPPATKRRGSSASSLRLTNRALSNRTRNRKRFFATLFADQAACTYA